MIQAVKKYNADLATRYERMELERKREAVLYDNWKRVRLVLSPPPPKDDSKPKKAVKFGHGTKTEDGKRRRLSFEETEEAGDSRVAKRARLSGLESCKRDS